MKSSSARAQAPASPRPIGWWARRAVLALVLVLALALVAAGIWIGLPLPDDLVHPRPVPGLVLQDRNGLPLRVVRAPGGERGGWISLADIDPAVPQAFLAAEDRRFFQHHGIDAVAVARAVWTDIGAPRVVSGASTLSMQAARAFRPLGHGFWGKARQAMWALRLEAHLDKRAILERYLNRVPLGQGTIGVAAASELYLGGPPRSLSLAQAALLASLARAPSLDNPFVSARRARARRDRVLRRMQAYGYAPAGEVARALAEPVTLPVRSTPFLAPHFTTEALGWAEQAQVAPVGRLRTSLDLELQGELEAEVRGTVAQLRDQGAGQAAAVVLDNRTGEILAWVGSPDFNAPDVGQVDMVLAPRQPGSALKPFLYAHAFDRGYTAATVLPDVPRTYPTSGGPYTPRNYDRRYHGPVRIREALGSSYNVPAVELADRVGVAALLGTLRAAGFASLDRPPEHYGLGLALGNGDVTLLELANAYRGLANGGVWRPVRWRPASDSAQRADVGASRRFVSRRAAVLTLDILGDATARVPGFGVETPFDLPFPAAGKTGTSRHYTDNWAAVTTGGFTIAVWVGNSSGQPMQGVSGISGAGPLLYRAALRVAARYPTGVLPTPAAEGMHQLAICRLTGLRATQDCATAVEWFAPGTEPTATGDWRGPDGRVHWPAEYAEWAAREPELVATLAPVTPGAHTGAGWGAAGHADTGGSGGASGEGFRIVSIADGDRFAVPPGVPARYATLPLRAAGGAADRGVRWFVDGRAVSGPRWVPVPGPHRIRAVSAAGEVSVVAIVVE